MVETTSGTTYPVVWPDGVHIGQVDGAPVMLGFFGQVIAREGDWIEMGGGYAAGDAFFTGCGEISVTDGPS